MTHSIYTENIGSPSSWAVQQLQLNGPDVCVGRSVGNFGSSTVTTPRIDTGTVAPSSLHAGDGGTPAAGDVLLAAVIAKDVGQTISPPAGWTTVTPIHGVGSRNVLLATFLKVAVAAEITGALTFTSSTADRMVAHVSSLPQATIDTTNPLLASPSVVSAVDLTTIDGPTTTGPGVPPFTVVEYVAQGSTVQNPSCNGGISDSSDFLFLNQQEDGGGTGSPDFCGMLGFRYYFAAVSQWHVDDAIHWRQH